MSENRKPNYWAVLPSRVRYDPDLRPNAKLLYAEISSLTNATGYCWSTNEYFAKLFNLSVGTVSRLITQLEARGYIRTEMVSISTGSERRIYAGIFGVIVEYGGIDEKDNTPLDENIKRGIDENGKPIIRNNNKTINNTPHPPKGGKGVRKRKEPREAPDWKPERFAGFWKFYPKQGRKNKQAAMDAWDKLHPDDGLIDRIAKALVKLKTTEDWKRGIGIPYAATFLNGARWADADELGDAETAPASGWADDEEVL